MVSGRCQMVSGRCQMVLGRCKMQTWNLSQASHACMCKVFWDGVKFYLEHTLFRLKICLSFL